MDKKNTVCVGSSSKLSSLVEFLKIIAEEHRLKILCLLKNGEKCVCEMFPKLGIPQNLASHHLKTLKDLDLISDRKEGLRVYYQLNKKELNKYSSLLSNFLEFYD